MARSSPGLVLTVPNERFFANRCTACVTENRKCNHAPFGEPFQWQLEWLRAFDEKRARLSHLEIHRRGRKTATAINLQFRECDRLPKTRQAYVGPTFAEARRIVWDDPSMLREALPDPRALGWKLNEQHMKVTFANGSVWQCFGGDNPDNLRGVDAQGFVFDEWAQQDERCWTEVLQPIFRQDPSRWAAFLYCVAPDTLVLSRDGWREIRDFHKGAEGFSECGDDVYGIGGFHIAEQFYSKRNVPTIRVQTRKGYEIECTPVHRLWTPDGWRYVGDLDIGSEVSIQYGQAAFGSCVGWEGFSYRPSHGKAKSLPFIPDEDFYYFLGLFIGDGYASSYNTVITTNDQEIRDFLANFGFVRRDKWHMVYSGSALSRLLDWFRCRKRAPEKQIPPQVLSAPRWVHVAFLRGLFDADGCSPRGRSAVSLCTTSSVMARQVQAMLLNLGIVSSRYQHKAPATTSLAQGRHCAWVVEMHSRFACLFHDQIGFGIVRKAIERPSGRVDGESVTVDVQRLAPDYFTGMNCADTARQVRRGVLAHATIERLHARKPDPYWAELLSSDTITDQIVSIVPSVSDVMDFVIPDTHSFVSNGFISHNTPKGYNHATRMFDHAACVDEGEPLPTSGAARRCRPGMFALRLCADHSGIFSADELEAVRNDPHTPKEMYEQEYLCARIADEQFALITSAMLDTLWRERARPKIAPAIIACDPSMGGDACAIDVQWGSKSILHTSFRTKDTMRIVGELRKISDETGILDFIIDSIGIGAGVAHALQEDTRYQVQAFNSAEHASESSRFLNKRAEMWWTAREDVANSECCKPDEETCRQIPFGSRYKVSSNGKIQIIDKDLIRKHLGRSPDDAEAWAMGRYGMRHARQCSGKMMNHVVQIPGHTVNQEVYDPMSFV